MWPQGGSHTQKVKSQFCCIKKKKKKREFIRGTAAGGEALDLFYYCKKLMNVGQRFTLPPGLERSLGR